MNPKTLTRTAVDLSVRTALAPWSTVARWTRSDDDRTSPLEVVVGRVDATVREVAGKVLRDDELVEDALQRRAAARNREVAIDLRAEAEAREAAAEEEREAREAQADAVREQAEQAAERKRQTAAKKAAKKKQAARKSAAAKKQTARKAAAATRQTVRDAERAARLEELSEQEQALAAEERAIAEEERATRLQDAAEQTKARR